MQSEFSSGENSAVLGVIRSFSGRFWKYRKIDNILASAITQRLNLPDILGRVLAARNVCLDEAPNYLDPQLKYIMPDPSVIKDMDLAAEKLSEAVINRKKIAVFGDYDVDGATSAALLQRYFSAVGSVLEIYIPDRVKEGYGPNIDALLKLKKQNVEIVITVDCGTSSYEAIEAANEEGLKVIVVDHHIAEFKLPSALAVVNPNRFDEENLDLKSLAAVGVTFMLVVAINRCLRKKEWFAKRNEPDIRKWLDLVALGTICDAVPLKILNRTFVLRGLEIMKMRNNPGIAALADIGKVKEKLNSYHLGYVLGPRVNAGGRVGHSDLGARILSTEDEKEAKNIAIQLDNFNIERRAIEHQVQKEALILIESKKLAKNPIIVVYGLNWHQGVIGIVASRLVEKFGKPVFVLSHDEKIAKGSGRSVNSFDIGALVLAAKQTQLLINGGGHPMAAGLTVSFDNLVSLINFFISRAKDLESSIAASNFLEIDSLVSVDGASNELAKLLEQAGPYGQGNPPPRLVICNANVLNTYQFGEDHISCILSSASGARVRAVAFRSLGKDLGRALISSKGKKLHLAGKLQIDTWNGRNDVQFIIDDAITV